MIQLTKQELTAVIAISKQNIQAQLDKVTVNQDNAPLFQSINDSLARINEILS